MNEETDKPVHAPSEGKFSEEKQGLANIDRRLREIRHDNSPESKLAARIKAPPGNVLGLAFRVSVELISALAVGAAIGWFLDHWLDTRPWLMLVFVVLGGAAGILNVYRLASGFGYATGYKSADTKTQDSSTCGPEQR